MAVRIIIDSTADYTPQEAQALGLLRAPLTIQWDGKEYRDGEDITPAAFFERLQRSAALPTTSQVPVPTFQALYRQVLEDGDQAVVLTLSQRLSGTFQSATIARNMLSPQEQERIFLVDGGTASLGTILLLRHAFVMRDSGASAAEIALELERVKSRLVIYACVETLKYLHKGGRLGTGAAVMGTLLSVKPVLRIQDGGITVAQKVRGNAAAYRWVAETMQSEGFDPAFPPMLGSTQCPALLEQFVATVQGIPLDTQQRHCQIGTVIGTHIGPGTVGIAFLTPET